MQRRDFLKKTGLLTIGSLLSTTLANAQIEPLKKGDTVLILGAGIAGLTAAYKLSKKGFKVIVLEARNRIGGRIFTYSFSETPNLYAELGAEWIGESHKEIRKLCDELGLKTIKHQYKIDLLLQEQHMQSKQTQIDSAWEEKMKQIFKNFEKLSEKEKKKLDTVSWWRFLMENGIPEQELLIRELNDSTDFGESIRQVSAYAALSEYAESSDFNEMDYQIVGGNSQIINALSEKIAKENILLNKKVSTIIQENQKVKVICDDKTFFEGHKIICTLPTFAISNIHWQPHLPHLKQEAISQLLYSRIIKTQLLFKERFWNRDDFAVNTDSVSHFIFHTSQKQNNSEKGILTSYATGDKAFLLSRMNKTQQAKYVIEALKPIFGDKQQLFEQGVSYYWGTDIYTQGAYAIYNINQWFGLKNILAQPFKNILFAGEYIGEWQGFMEGAVQTALNCVDAIS
ncbi:MAG: NAD(P)/FAD-dependent oxidoreductase [Raineya sp.]|jgi:monoamine oxidase|nr:NAD(P)/FAD-dependent oxidoreductase [Raineya sp.]